MSIEAPAAQTAQSLPSANSAPQSAPWFTWSLIVLLVVIFGAEMVLNLEPDGKSLGPSLSTLYALGGVSRSAVVGQGQWWRVFTAPLLHASIPHVLFNGLALFLVGRHLEPRLGWRWMSATFAVSAVAGSLMSIALNAPGVISVGASGGIVGVFAIAIGVANRLSPDPPPRAMLRWAIYGLLSSFATLLLNVVHQGDTTTIEFGIGTGASGVDYAAHFGGAAAGALFGVLLLPRWRYMELRPPVPVIAVTIAGAYFAVVTLSLAAIANLYGESMQLDPNVHGTVGNFVSEADELVRRHPHDPTVLYVKAVSMLGKGDAAGAEAALRAGLAETGILDDLVPSMRPILQAQLAAVLYAEKKTEEAKVMAVPVCDEAPAQLVVILQNDGLCPDTTPPPALQRPTPPPVDQPSVPAPPGMRIGTIDVARRPSPAPVTRAATAPQPTVDAGDPTRVLDDAREQLRQGDADKAAAELQAALKDTSRRDVDVAPAAKANMAALLAVALYVRGEDQDAKAVAERACPFETTGLYAKLLRDDKLCP